MSLEEAGFFFFKYGSRDIMKSVRQTSGITSMWFLLAHKTELRNSQVKVQHNEVNMRSKYP